MASAGARAYICGSGGFAPSGVRVATPPEAESYLLMSRQILPGFLHVYYFVLKLPCTHKQIIEKFIKNNYIFNSLKMNCNRRLGLVALVRIFTETSIKISK